MKSAAALPPLLAILLLSACASHRNYSRLPDRDTAIDLTAASVDTFVIELDPANGEPTGVRLEFDQDDPSRSVKTTYAPGRPARQTFLNAAETARLKAALLAFDWNHAEDPQDPTATRLVRDDTIILFRARVGSVYHEVRVGLANSTALDHLLHQLGLLK